jgi:hypothetical protein
LPTLTIYPQPEFPAIFKWQVIAFMRMEWPSIFQGDNLYMPETYPPEFDPIHYVVAEGDTLLSYGALLKLKIDHGGSDYSVYGFGNMLTFPPFAHQGWGGQVLQAATRFIQQSDVDIAALFCDPGLDSYYAMQGWTVAHSATRLGRPDLFEEYLPLRMMLFVSEKGRLHRAEFETQPMYIELPW